MTANDLKKRFLKLGIFKDMCPDPIDPRDDRFWLNLRNDPAYFRLILKPNPIILPGMAGYYSSEIRWEHNATVKIHKFNDVFDLSHPAIQKVFVWHLGLFLFLDHRFLTLDQIEKATEHLEDV